MLRDKQYIKRLGFVRQHVRNKWEENKGLPARYTIHDASHAESVEKAIYKLIPKTKYSELSEEEKFYLLSSAWLHDIGMIPDLLGRKEEYQKVRSQHHIRSMKYVEEQRQELGLELGEAKTIAQLCKYHTKSEDILRCQRKFGEISLRLLASYLRLADAIHVDKTRVDQSLFKIFLEIGMPWDSKYHWLKSFWIEDVLPDFKNLTITIQLLISQDDAQDLHIIRNMIEQEVRTELYTVRDILIRGGISYFLDVETKLGPGIEDNQKIDLMQIIGNIQLEQKPSASDVVATIVSTTLPILDLPDKRQAYSILKTYQNEVIKAVIKNRPCHMLVKKIDRLIEDNMKENEQDLSDIQIKDNINNVKTKIQEFRRFREERVKTLFSFARSILSDFGSVLLFGYSNLVIKALERAKSKFKKSTMIYVCECSAKNQYNEMNELIYCDGIKYASKIRKIGFTGVYSKCQPKIDHLC